MGSEEENVLYVWWGMIFSVLFETTFLHVILSLLYFLFFSEKSSSSSLGFPQGSFPHVINSFPFPQTWKILFSTINFYLLLLNFSLFSSIKKTFPIISFELSVALTCLKWNLLTNAVLNTLKLSSSCKGVSQQKLKSYFHLFLHHHHYFSSFHLKFQRNYSHPLGFSSV